MSSDKPDIERAKCETCHLSIEGEVPASLVCSCGTRLEIHGGGPATTVDLSRPPRTLDSALSYIHGGGTYA